jgi:hypothetical protein
VSIVRVGLSETKKFAEGYEAIFGKKEIAASSDTGAAEGQGQEKKSPKAKSSGQNKKKSKK